MQVKRSKTLIGETMRTRIQSQQLVDKKTGGEGGGPAIARALEYEIETCQVRGSSP